ncbi:hypothetical protein BJX76DRAFT_357779 [Aspergillus varians]
MLFGYEKVHWMNGVSITSRGDSESPEPDVYHPRRPKLDSDAGARDLDKGQKYRAETFEYVKCQLGLYDPTKPLLGSSSEVINSFDFIGDALRARHQRRIFLEESRFFIAKSEVKQRLRLRDNIVALEEFWQYRLGTSAVTVVLAVKEYCNSTKLPSHTTADPDFAALWQLTNVNICSVNDLLSVKKEIPGLRIHRKLSPHPIRTVRVRTGSSRSDHDYNPGHNHRVRFMLAKALDTVFRRSGLGERSAAVYRRVQILLYWSSGMEVEQELNRLERHPTRRLHLPHPLPLPCPIPPVHSSPSHVLDIGCGTGIRTRRFASKHRTSQVLGIDIHPPTARAIDLTDTPSNCTFTRADLEKDEDWASFLASHYSSAPLDFIYIRMLLFARYLAAHGMRWDLARDEISQYLKETRFELVQDVVITMKLDPDDREPVEHRELAAMRYVSDMADIVEGMTPRMKRDPGMAGFVATREWEGLEVLDEVGERGFYTTF